MTANVEFRKLEQKIQRTSDVDEKAEIIRQLLDIFPSYPGLSSKKQKYKRMLDTLERKKEFSKVNGGAEEPYALPRYKLRDFIIGPPNTGKSTLLNQLTGSTARVADYPFTTYKPEIGMMRHNNVSIQLVELPAMFDGDYDSNKRKYELLRNGSGLAIVVGDIQGLEMTIDELDKADIQLESPQSQFGNPRSKQRKPAFIVHRDMDYFDIGLPFISANSTEEIKAMFYLCLGVIAVYPYINGKRGEEPFILDASSPTVAEFAGKITEDYQRRFAGAKVWGKSVRFDGQMVGLDHVLAEGDNVYLVKR